MAAQDQKVEFLFAAQVSGQEQLKKLTDAVDSLRKEMEALKAANGGTGAAMQQFSRSIGNASSHVQAYQKHLDAQAKAMRNHRQGTQQLGMQFNDLGTSISTGASPIQAFNQQLGQMGYALSMMKGKAGEVGAFLAGPWGAAIVIATMALGPLIEAFFNTSKAAQELQEMEKAGREASINLLEAKAELDKALGKNTENYKLAKQAAFDSAFADLTAANTAITASKIRVSLAQKEKRIVDSIKESEGGAIGGFLLGALGFGNVDAAVKESDKAITASEAAYAAVLKARAQLVNAMKGTTQTGSSAVGRVGGAGQAGKSDLEKQQDKDAKSLEDFFNLIERGNTKELPEYARQIMAIEEAFLKLNAAQQASDKNRFTKIFAQDKIFLKEGQDQISEYLKTPIEAPQMSVEMEDIISKADEMRQSFDAVGSAVANSFKGMVTGAMSFRTAMKGIIGAVIDELFRLYVVQQVVGVVKGALGGLFGVPTLPGKALGGSVTGNKPYMVGERGPELFVPGGNGTIIPNQNVRGSGGGRSFNISVDARGSSDPAAVRAQVQQGILEAAPAIIAAAESRTISSLRRPRLGGVMQ